MTDFYRLKNGMALLGERMDHVQSVSFQFLLPGGAALLADGCSGAANLISDWMFRGTADRTSRQLVETLDSLGIHRSESTHAYHLSLSASLESGNLAEALNLYAEVILRSALNAEQFELSRQLAVSDLQGLDDDPRQKVMMLLTEQFYPDPLGRPAMGKIDELTALTAQTASGIARAMINPADMIFSVSGHYDFGAVCGQMERLFGSLAMKPEIGRAHV
jgi:predicted Zn-dependent peptidase